MKVVKGWYLPFFFLLMFITNVHFQHRSGRDKYILALFPLVSFEALWKSGCWVISRNRRLQAGWQPSPFLLTKRSCNYRGAADGGCPLYFDTSQKVKQVLNVDVDPIGHTRCLHLLSWVWNWDVCCDGDVWLAGRSWMSKHCGEDGKQVDQDGKQVDQDSKRVDQVVTWWNTC